MQSSLIVLETLENMNTLKKLYACGLLICIFMPSISLAEPILDKVEIIQTATEADIHIDFQTQIRYLRHSPTKDASRIQIFLEFPEYQSLGLAIPTKREFINSPPTKLVPAFTVNFPDQKTNTIAIKFKKPVKFRVTPDSSGRGIIVHVPLPKGVAPLPKVKVLEPMPSAVDAGTVDIPGLPEGMSVNEYANKLVAESRVAAGLGDYPKAIELLNTVLNLPFATASEDAQELIGVAREKNGELSKAKAEYEQYLKLYPESEGAKRVRQHLSRVDADLNAGKGAKQEAKKEIQEIHETTVFGSWDQYYYDAHSHTRSSDNRSATHPSDKKSTHDQSSLVSSINLTARSRQNQYDSKIVFRNRQTMDFIPSHNNKNSDRTDAAYVEVANKEVDYLVRLGRQNGNSGGVLGRFDGAWLRYGFTPHYRINVVAGTLDEFSVDYRRHFYGINLDIGPIAESWSGNIFFVNQEVKDITDRRAVGGELRYFSGGKSLYSLIDYDTLYNRVNIAMAQGNLQTEGGTNFNALIDHRKSPILTTVNSLTSQSFLTQAGVLRPGAPVPTTLNRALRHGFTETELRQYAIDNTLETDTVLFGATRQVTPRWQLGGDIQVNRTTGTPGASASAVELYKKRALENGIILTDQDITNFTNSVGGSGNIWTYHAQAVGTDTLFKDDTSVISATYSTGKVSHSQSILFSNGFAPAEKWRIDSSLQLLRQDSDPSTLSYTISPTVRASYRLREKATLEAEIRFDVDNTESAGVKTRTVRDAAFVGYRIDI